MNNTMIIIGFVVTFVIGGFVGFSYEKAKAQKMVADTQMMMEKQVQEAKMMQVTPTPDQMMMHATPTVTGMMHDTVTPKVTDAMQK